MFADAVREVRFHPGRVVATIVAIAISVAFMVASSTFITTQQHSLGKQLALQISKADLVVTAGDPETQAKVTPAVEAVPGVARVEESIVTTGPLRSEQATVMAVLYVVPSEEFRWATVREGAWPTTDAQITLAKEAADKLGVGVGDTVTYSGDDLVVTGITNDPRSIFQQTAYVSMAWARATGLTDQSSGQWLVKAEPGTDLDALVPRLVAATSALGAEVKTAETYANEQLDELTEQTNVMKLMLGGFAAVALVVGMIIIANTFTILLAQRRRQIGLLRAVGASGSQVRRKFLAEAILLGAIGSALGVVLGVLVAAIGTWFVGTLSLGMTIPWLEVGAEFIVGVVITVLAAIVPMLRSTRVAPLEALQPVQTVEAARASSRVRMVICGVLVVAGAGLALVSQFTDSWPLVWALGGAMLLTLGVLGGAPLYVPSLVKAFGRVVGLTGPTARLATTNAVRNPGRASATATALMLAVGLIVTLQVGTATIEKTVLAKIDERYPVDISLAATLDWSDPNPSTTDPLVLPADVIAQGEKLSGVTASAVLEGTTATDVNKMMWNLSALTPEAAAAAPTAPTSIPDGTIYIGRTDDSSLKSGGEIDLWGDKGKATLTIVHTTLVEGQAALVSPATLADLTAEPVNNLMWLKLADRGDMASAFLDLQTIMEKYMTTVSVGGGALMAYMIERVLGILLLITTALLGVAVLIALVGVSNTLGLSVIERTRESALLRAMGMQKGSLRLMLLVEAMLLALTGVIVGVVFGAFFGWLGISAVLRQADLAESTKIRFAIDPWLTLALLAVAAVAAALASVLPGRRAANAAPVEALAEE